MEAILTSSSKYFCYKTLHLSASKVINCFIFKSTTILFTFFNKF
jgi:hypothetical protein